MEPSAFCICGAVTPCFTPLRAQVFSSAMADAPLARVLPRAPIRPGARSRARMPPRTGQRPSGMRRWHLCRQAADPLVQFRPVSHVYRCFAARFAGSRDDIRTLTRDDVVSAPQPVRPVADETRASARVLHAEPTFGGTGGLPVRHHSSVEVSRSRARTTPTCTPHLAPRLHSLRASAVPRARRSLASPTA